MPRVDGAMRGAIRPPSDLRNPLDLADWMELSALVESDGSASKSQLESLLIRASAAADGSEAERQALVVFGELERRARLCGKGYPFEVRLPVLARRRDLRRVHWPYRFCLALSYVGWKPVKGAAVNPWLLFESVSAYAAAQFFCSFVYVFGTSARGDTGEGFRDRIDGLARALGEGRAFRDQDTKSAKDDHVDLIAVRKLDGERKSNLVVFGQCASGDNWRSKDSELDATAFFDQWFVETKVSHLGHSFFVPHCFDDDTFEHVGRRAGVLFDRLRVARWASTHHLDDNLITQMKDWVTKEFQLPDSAAA